MATRDTRTGAVLEKLVLPALIAAGYTVRPQVVVGTRPGGRNHVVDLVASNSRGRYLVSLKWQQVAGTAEQKVPFEIICLAAVLGTSNYDRAYLVLGGEGWRLRDYYTSGALREHIRDSERVEVVTFERFVALANQGKL